jgi:hypothetical protein
MQVEQKNSPTQLQKERAFTTNWYIYRVCIPTVKENKTRCEISEEASTLEDSSSCNHCFEELLSEAVDEKLSLLGETVKQVVYDNLKRRFKIDKRAIPYRIDQFATAIERMFGDGAKLLEIEIMKSLHEKAGENAECSSGYLDLVFTKYVEAVKSSMKHR